MDRLNRWLTLVANLGVLVGIFLVFVELGQNREAIQAQTRHELAVQLVDLLSQVAGDPELAAALNAAGAGAEMDPVETTQFQHRVLSMFRYFENVHYQYRQGLYDPDEFGAQLEAWRSSGYAQMPAAQALWCDSRAFFSPEFRSAFDDLVAEGC